MHAYTYIDRDRQRQTETDRDRQRQTETDRDRQRQTETDRDRQRQTETDRETDRETYKRIIALFRPSVGAFQANAFEGPGGRGFGHHDAHTARQLLAAEAGRLLVVWARNGDVST